MSETPNINRMVTTLETGREPSDAEAKAAFLEGVALLLGGLRSLERIADALERDHRPPSGPQIAT